MISRLCSSSGLRSGRLTFAVRRIVFIRGFCLSSVCLVLSAQADSRWERVPADLSRIKIPPLLRVARYDFKIEFIAEFNNRRLVKFRELSGPAQLVPTWATSELPKIRLGRKAKLTTGHFRLCMNISDPRLEQKLAQ